MGGAERVGGRETEHPTAIRMRGRLQFQTVTLTGGRPSPGPMWQEAGLPEERGSAGTLPARDGSPCRRWVSPHQCLSGSQAQFSAFARAQQCPWTGEEWRMRVEGD